MDVLTEARTGRRPRWKRRLLIALPLLLVAVIGAGALALYAYDRSQSDRIAAGMRVADVEIGGLGVKQAQAKLVRVLLPRYRRPLVIAAGQRRFVLSSDKAGLRVEIAAAVASARAISRQGSFLDRAYRELRGRRLAVELEPRLRYSPRAVVLFIERVRRAVRVRPRSARFLPSLTRPRLVPSRPGLALRGVRVRSWIEAQLPDPNSKRVLPLPTRVLAPTLTTAAARRTYRYFIA